MSALSPDEQFSFTALKSIEAELPQGLIHFTNAGRFEKNICDEQLVREKLVIQLVRFYSTSVNGTLI